MSRTLRGLTIAVAVAVLIGGCTGDDSVDVEPTRSPGVSPSVAADPPTATPEATAPSTATPDPAEADYRYRIQGKVRADYFDGGTPARYRHWVPRLSYSPDRHVSIDQRRLPGCDTGPWLHFQVDRGARDFAHVIRDSGTGFVVARQLTVYDDAASAKQLVPQLNSRTVGCYRYAGRFVVAVEVSSFGEDRFFGITTNHDGTVFSEGYNATAGQSANWVDVVTRENNAVVLTRVTDLAYEGDPDVIGRKEKQQRFVAAVRRQGTISARTLNAFR